MNKNNNNIKRERFLRIASKRVQRALECLEILSKCSNRNNYEYTETDVQKMFRVIKERLKTSELMFEENLSKKRRQPFKF